MGVSPEGMIVLVWFFLAFDLIFLTIRLYLIITRPRMTRAALISEACICLAFILFSVETISTTAYQGTLIKYRNHSAIDKSTGMPRSKLILFLKFQLAEVEFYLTGIWLIKGSFIALYFDIFRSLPAKAMQGLYITAIYTALSWLANFLLPLLYCHPISLVWSIEGHCTSFRSRLGTKFPMITNVTTDLLIIVIPVLVLRTFNLRKSEILAIAFLLCMGCLTIAATLLRYTYVTKRNAQGRGGDPNLITQAQIWSYAEGCVAFFAACLPASRVLLSRKRQRCQTMNVSKKFELRSSSMKPSRITTEDLSQVDSDHSLVVLKTTSFDVESAVDLTSESAGIERRATCT